MKNKKMLSLVLALAMILSLAVPVFATDDDTINYTGGDDQETTVTITSSLQNQIIKVSLESAPGAVLNPYQLGYSARTGSNYKLYDQIASKDNLIISTSNVPLGIGVVASGKGTSSVRGTDLRLLTEAPENDATGRDVYMYAVFKELDTSDFTDTSKVKVADVLSAPEKVYPTDKDTKQQKPIEYPTTLVFEETETAKVNAILIKPTPTGSVTPTPVYVDVKLAANNSSKDSNGNSVEKTVSAVSYRLNGQMVAEPKTGAWTSDDSVEVSLAFTFTPRQADVRQQKIWGMGNFALDVVNAIKLNNDAAPAAINMSAPNTFALYKQGDADTDYIALSLLLPDKAKVTAPTTTEADSGILKEQHEDADGNLSAFADITGKKAKVKFYQGADSDLDGYVLIKTADLVTAAIDTKDVKAVQVPFDLKYKIGDTETTIAVTATVNIDDTLPGATNNKLTRVFYSDDATLTAAQMKAALGATAPANFTLSKVSGSAILATTGAVQLATDGSVKIANSVLDVAGNKEPGSKKYATLEFTYTDGGPAQVGKVDLYTEVALNLTPTASGNYSLASGSDITFTIPQANLPTGNGINAGNPAYTFTNVAGDLTSHVNVADDGANKDAKITVDDSGGLDSLTLAAGDTVTITGLLGWAKDGGGTASATVKLVITVAA